MARELVFAALATAAACSHEQARQQPAAPPLASKAFYRIDGSPSPCHSGSVCEAHLVLSALGAYHVNPDYPFKFVGDTAADVQPDGTGTFALDGAKRGTLTVKFTPARPGTTKLVGTFKLSVCSDDNCEIETPKIELGIPVS